MSTLSQVTAALNNAFIKSTLSPLEFFKYIKRTRNVLRNNEDLLGFEVVVNGARKWFWYVEKSNSWIID